MTAGEEQQASSSKKLKTAAGEMELGWRSPSCYELYMNPVFPFLCLP
jgi:hypothetical protein